MSLLTEQLIQICAVWFIIREFLGVFAFIGRKILEKRMRL